MKKIILIMVLLVVFGCNSEEQEKVNEKIESVSIPSASGEIHDGKTWEEKELDKLGVDSDMTPEERWDAIQKNGKGRKAMNFNID